MTTFGCANTLFGPKLSISLLRLTLEATVPEPPVCQPRPWHPWMWFSGRPVASTSGLWGALAGPLPGRSPLPQLAARSSQGRPGFAPSSSFRGALRPFLSPVARPGSRPTAPRSPWHRPARPCRPCKSRGGRCIDRSPVVRLCGVWKDLLSCS